MSPIPGTERATVTGAASYPGPKAASGGGSDATGEWAAVGMRKDMAGPPCRARAPWKQVPGVYSHLILRRGWNPCPPCQW